MMEDIYIAFGSNVGDREENICNALRKLSEKLYFVVASSIYETHPWGIASQPDFLNSVAFFKYDGDPEGLLSIVLDVENSLGKAKSVKWGPRNIDIDILLFGTRVIKTANLIIPHKYLALRDFFLVPLLEISPDVVHHGTGIKLIEYEKRLPHQLRTIFAKKEVPQWQDTITMLSKVP